MQSAPTGVLQEAWPRIKQEIVAYIGSCIIPDAALTTLFKVPWEQALLPRGLGNKQCCHVSAEGMRILWLLIVPLQKRK